MRIRASVVAALVGILGLWLLALDQQWKCARSTEDVCHDDCQELCPQPGVVTSYLGDFVPDDSFGPGWRRRVWTYPLRTPTCHCQCLDGSKWKRGWERE
jgi:hypothetical protein